MDKVNFQGTRVAQSVKHPTHDLSSGLNIKVVSSSPTLGMKYTLKKKKNEVSFQLGSLLFGDNPKKPHSGQWKVSK